MRRLWIPAVTFAVTVWCARGLSVTPTMFLAVWAGLSVAFALIWRLWLEETLS